jgi:hypothetical protein
MNARIISSQEARALFPKSGGDADLDLAAHLMSDTSINGGVFHSALVAAKIYEKHGMGSKPFVRKKLIEASKKSKFLPTPDEKKEFDDFLKRNPESHMTLFEKFTALFGFSFLFSGIFLFSNKATGYAISDLIYPPNNLLAFSFLAIGLIGLAFLSKKRCWFGWY